MRLVTVITDPAVIGQILTHRARARGPVACLGVPEAAALRPSTAGSAGAGPQRPRATSTSRVGGPEVTPDEPLPYLRGEKGNSYSLSVLQQGVQGLESPSIRLALAEAQLEVGWLGLAELNARTAAARYPDRLLPRLLLARIHHAQGDDAQARAALASCIRRDTYFRSAPVDSVVTQATRLWRNWYDDEPPR